MSISPFSTRPTSSQGDSRRVRLVLLIAALGIAATLLAYVISPGVKHAVSHAAHSVKHAVGHVLDPDTSKHKPSNPAVKPKVTAPAKSPPVKKKSLAPGSSAPPTSTHP